ncbi:MAG: hypothetical protein Q8P41_29465 [Pseudomonadota bacterium]|nr:hypothetical protein [Pseudomonadota bacterium]
MSRALLLALFGLALFGVAACDVDYNDDTACTEIAVVSVTVHVSTEDGAVVEPEVTWTMGDSRSDCDAYGEGTYGCGYEVAGTLTIDVHAPGYEDFGEYVQVEADECHVIPETLDVVLVPIE